MRRRISIITDINYFNFFPGIFLLEHLLENTRVMKFIFFISPLIPSCRSAKTDNAKSILRFNQRIQTARDKMLLTSSNVLQLFGFINSRCGGCYYTIYLYSAIHKTYKRINFFIVMESNSSICNFYEIFAYIY